jgi:hypothetical protein
MNKTNKPVPKAPARKAPATKQSVAKPKLKKAQSQAELLPIVERLAQAAERLAQAAERLTEAMTGGPAVRAHEATTRQNPAPDSVL